VVVPPDFYLARVVPGSAPGLVAAALRAGPLAEGYKVEQAGSSTVRGLTALNLAGLGRIESVGAVLIAAVGVAVLGAFLVLERRREFAILRAVGAATANVLHGPALEGAIAAAGSLVVGVPVGLGLAVLREQ
jgi:putative ABC transport system permease protein